MGTIIDPPTNPFGLSPVDFTFSVAANNSQTTARVFAHGINSTVVLQPEQGEHCLADISAPSCCCCAAMQHLLEASMSMRKCRFGSSIALQMHRCLECSAVS